MSNETCGQCKYYHASKNKKVGTCQAPLPYHAILEFTNWYVTYNDNAAKLCAMYDPMWKNLEGCVVYD